MKDASNFAVFLLTLFYAVIFGGILIGAVIAYVAFILEVAKDCPVILPMGIIGIVYLILYQVAVFGRK